MYTNYIYIYVNDSTIPKRSDRVLCQCILFKNMLRNLKDETFIVIQPLPSRYIIPNTTAILKNSVVILSRVTFFFTKKYKYIFLNLIIQLKHSY